VYACADVFCFPSTTDTFGQVLLEAAASGLPVVAAASGGGAELVGHRTTGLLVPPDDAAAFADALGELVDDVPWRRSLGRRARAAALERSWITAYDELALAYRAATLRPAAFAPIAA
jgi:glycosyltransferase involved in cell wall biosynthesis